MQNSVSFSSWKRQTTFIGKGSYEGTMEQAVLYFFYDGVCPFVKGIGYKWITSDNEIARRFLQLCYMIHTTRRMEDKYSIKCPDPEHRNLVEDRDVYDFFLDTFTFNDFLEHWSDSPIVGSRFDYLFKEFIYIWIDVTSGKPGSMTQKILDADKDDDSEEDISTSEISHKKDWSLY